LKGGAQLCYFPFLRLVFFAVFFARFFGTLAPFFLASDKPMAMACFLLFTFLPEPDFNVPFFFLCMALFTRLPAPLEYLAIKIEVSNAFDFERMAKNYATGFIIKPFDSNAGIQFVSPLGEWKDLVYLIFMGLPKLIRAYDT
jgi:hypothetical protein